MKEVLETQSGEAQERIQKLSEEKTKEKQDAFKRQKFRPDWSLHLEDVNADCRRNVESAGGQPGDLFLNSKNSFSHGSQRE